MAWPAAGLMTRKLYGKGVYERGSGASSVTSHLAGRKAKITVLIRQIHEAI